MYFVPMRTSTTAPGSRRYAPNRIKDIRTQRGLTLEEVALAFDPPVASGTINKLENRRMALSLDYINQLVRVLACSPLDLIAETEPRKAARMLPIAGSIAAGNWREAVAVADEYMAVPGHLKGDNLFVLRVSGDSMGNHVPDGGYIVVDPDQRDLMDGKLYAIMNASHDTTFKQFRATPSPRLVPLSSNAEHREMPLGHEPIVTIGRIIHGGADFE